MESAEPVVKPLRVVVDRPANFAELLTRVGLNSVSEIASVETSFSLVEREGRLDLRPPGESEKPGIQAQFPPDRIETNARNPLIRAFGKKTDPIFDLTAGLGGDAYRLARAGHQVFAFERNPAVYAVLSTGWARDCALGQVDPNVAKRLEFGWEEGAAVLTRLNRLDQFDVGVYLDPMYPNARRQRALPKRELQVLRQLLGDAEEAAELVEAARLCAARVVVKRPHRAPPLTPDVSFEISTKLVRFDVYVNPSKMGSVES